MHRAGCPCAGPPRPQGVRIDYALVSHGLLGAVAGCEIVGTHPKWSDHAALLLELRGLPPPRAHAPCAGSSARDRRFNDRSQPSVAALLGARRRPRPDPDPNPDPGAGSGEPRGAPAPAPAAAAQAEGEALGSAGAPDGPGLAAAECAAADPGGSGGGAAAPHEAPSAAGRAASPTDS